jgi:hypothetical protein
MMTPRRHCERSEAIQSCRPGLDCFIASLLAMAKVSAANHWRAADLTKSPCAETHWFIGENSNAFDFATAVAINGLTSLT